MAADKQPAISSNYLTQRLDVSFALQAAGLGVWELDPVSNQVLWNDRCRQLFGLAHDNPMSYEQAIQYIHSGDITRVDKAVQWAMNPQSGGHYDVTYRTVGADDGQLRWVRFTGKSYFRPDGQLARFAGVAQEVTQHTLAQQALQQSEARFRSILEQAPMAIGLLKGQEMVIELGNEQIFEVWGKNGSVTGLPLMEALPELEGQGFLELLQGVYTTGVAYQGYATEVMLVRRGQLEAVYFDFTYTPLRASDDTITGVMVLAIEVTQQVMTRRQVEASEARLRGVIAAAPAGIGLFIGPELVIESPNQTFIDIVGKGPSVEGLPLREAMPELLTEGQPFLTILDEVFTTGEPFISPASLVKIRQNGVLNDNYYNISYTPLRDATGAIYGILDIAIDVTQEVLLRQQIEQARQALKQSQDSLQAMIDLAQLGTYQIDLTTNELIKSPRVANWYGLPELTDVAASLSQVHPRDQLLVGQVVEDTLRPESSDSYQVEYTVVNAQTQEQHVLQTIGLVRRNAAGKPVSIDGLVRDVTLQRNQQLTLEDQVQQRTEELAATNEELLASNEEVSQTNRFLEVANDDLKRSNENLQQFAYIASHDLQEPLRKIQSFGNLLLAQTATELSQEHRFMLGRMVEAGSRMSTLVGDLLAYSRIGTRQQVFGLVSLPSILEQVLDTLDLAIEQAGATVEVAPLPRVSGDEGQLTQLFQNLITNALKFTPPGQSPRVRITYSERDRSELPPALRPTSQAERFHQISVADNGIGFDQKYTDRIFQVFQRLHGKGHYPGTGIGLAICQRVVDNHGGVITANSKPGQGATFSVYLPL